MLSFSVRLCMGPRLRGSEVVRLAAHTHAYARTRTQASPLTDTASSS